MVDRLAEASHKWKARIHGYCLMPNHFHLLIQVQKIPLSTILRSMSTAYAIYFSQTHHKQGHVFQGRCHAILCDKDAYLLELIHYIHLNSLRAGLVEQLRRWRWSSLPIYLGRARNDWLYQRDALAMLGKQP